MRSRVSQENFFSAFFEEQRLNDSFKYATLPRNFHRTPPDKRPNAEKFTPARVNTSSDLFSPNNSQNSRNSLNTSQEYLSEDGDFLSEGESKVSVQSARSYVGGRERAKKRERLQRDRAIANLRVMNTITLERHSSRLPGGLTPSTDRKTGAFAKFREFHGHNPELDSIDGTVRKLDLDYPIPPSVPPATPERTAQSDSDLIEKTKHLSGNIGFRKSDQSENRVPKSGSASSASLTPTRSYRPALAAAKSPFLKPFQKRLIFEFGNIPKSENPDSDV